MPEAWLRKLMLIAITSAVLAAMVRVLRGDPAPQFADHHETPVGARRVLVPTPTDPTVTEPVPSVARATLTPAVVAPSAERLTLAPRVGAPLNDLAAELGQGELHLVPAVAASRPPTSDPSGTWAEPIDGACPPGFPVKAKLTSGIFHVPGGLSYDRTKPDRCYPTAVAAEADGLRAARR